MVGGGIYDVTIGGVSLVKNYRANFAGQVRKGGIEALLENLSRHNLQWKNK